MNSFTKTGSLFLLLICSVSAQISIESVTTDTIDIFNTTEVNETRAKTALWTSLLLPGSGHQILGYRYRALGLVSFDIISLFSALYFRQHALKIEKNYKAYASFHAGISSSIHDDYYWQIIGNFNRYEDYHQTVDLIRDFNGKYISQQYYWWWEDESFRKDFISMQKNAKKFSTVSSFFFGAMILNRILAFIDTRSIQKNERYSQKQKGQGPEIYCSFHNNGIFLTATY